MIIIGAGRVGTALHTRSLASGVSCELVERDQGWDALDGPPGVAVVVAVRNDDLPDVVAQVPLHRRDDLVFIQNGMVRTWLRKNALGRCTRGLLYFAVPRRGAEIVFGDSSPFCGPYGLAMVQWLVTIGVKSHQVDWASFSARELEKLIWNSAFGLMCEHYGCSVGTIVDDHHGELQSLVTEMSAVGRAKMGVDVPLDFLMGRLCDYSRTIADYRGGVSEFPWRNGWFVKAAAQRNVSTPVHHELLRSVGRPQD
ncbi:MAG: hypothetical protein HN348_23800 [Proteobacteria bacterium]|jgi:hypothetical protein|nr:hypothetical protein [Pseudomonadota bacterium]